MAAIHIIIKGKVQGVFFRATAKEVADQIGITGNVRNTGEGHVEVWACGPEERIHRFLAWCRKGPSRARVDEVVSEPVKEQDFDGFTVIRS